MPPESETARLTRAVERQNRILTSWKRPVWQGLLTGVGSTLGLAAVLWILSLVIQPLKYLPVIGDFLGDRIEAAIGGQSGLPAASDDPADANDSTATDTTKPSSSLGTGTASLSTNYFAASLAGSWSVKLNQHSGSTEPIRLEASRTNATFLVTVTAAATATDHADLLDQADITVDGERGTRQRYADGTRETIETELSHQGKFYRLALTYDPATVDGPAVFDAAAVSFRFKD